MRSSKPEKKTKKVKKRSREEVESVENVSMVVNDEADVAGADAKGYKSKKARKPEKRIKKRSQEPVENGNDSSIVVNNEVDVAGSDMKAYKSKKARKNKSKDNPSSGEPSIVVNKPVEEVPSIGQKVKSKKAHKKKGGQSANRSGRSVEEVQEGKTPNVYQISLEEEDDSKGMKKWMKEYYEKRPGLKILQERIDDFISAHEEQEEQAKREREANLTEEGWTVVVHRKGWKRTADPESGVAVGSVAEAAVRDKLAKKKSKDVGLDFYRFQRKEAHRSELMKLQSKFEEDKKRIQQLRAARKFRPY